MERRSTGRINLDGSAEEGILSPSSTARPSSSLSFGQSQVQAEIEAAETEAETEAETGPGSKVKEASLNDFPPQILTTVLECVDTRSLFEYRLVNRQWSAVASDILCKRRDAKITFTFTKESFLQNKANKGTRTEADGRKIRLQRFLHCMKKSENSPFARFEFLFEKKESFRTKNLPLDYSDVFNHEDYKAFLSAVDECSDDKNQNQKIKLKSLALTFWEVVFPLKPLIDHLKDLLLHKTPHLEELGLNFMELDHGGETEGTELFPKSAENTLLVQLPHLKTIRFNNIMIRGCPGILKDLLGAAVNLQKILLYKITRYFIIEVYDFLQPLGKFHLIKGLKFCADYELLSIIKERPDFTLDFFKLELEELKMHATFFLNSDADAGLGDARNFMSSFFEFSQNSLKQLKIGSFYFSPRQSLQVPKFITLAEHRRVTCDIQPIDRLVLIFPALRKYKHNFRRGTYVSYSGVPLVDSISGFPRLETLIVGEIGLTQETIPFLSSLCPNLKHLKIHRPYRRAPEINFFEIGRVIWTELNQLESLEVDIDLDLPQHNPSALDSCFTGIPLKTCKRLYEMRLARPKKGLKIWGFQVIAPASEPTAERKHPSILDMTNLKRLKINPYCGEKFLHCTDFWEKLTWVSEEHAFKFMPHVKPKSLALEDWKGK